MSARKKYNVKYPTMYASKAETKEADKFNCAQRAHQNTLENVPMFLVVALLGGLLHPLACAIGAGVYNLGKICYIYGYSRGSPEGRYIGTFSYIGYFVLLGTCSLSLYF